MPNIITLLVAYKGNQKIAEMDISGMTDREVKREIVLQEAQGRKWEYHTTNREQMKEKREGR